MRIGIDPGITGAIAFIGDDGRLLITHAMPVMAGTGKRQVVNVPELARLLQYRVNYPPPTKPGEIVAAPRVTAYLEQVSAMPGQGVSSMFGFGRSFGNAEAVLLTLGIPTVYVTPQAWKKRAGLIGKDKDAARSLAQRLYPEAPLGRKKDVGRADAILIARFGE